ncbi:Fungal specific transcription factor domain [Rhizoctonia solani]|uniref:Fungal specific transcription factor domain n=1 Tax=Rhizoctonia solani TaxID=456999 RepID=A0A8H8NSZ7_9AGAM|nr:Fungal specific transcription factor domain [Rhizoctonia solani]QRW19471.1 Fungal specific transcription factor domain [Rhizoctonia solani]
MPRAQPQSDSSSGQLPQLLKRNQVRPTFCPSESKADYPTIFRHVINVGNGNCDAQKPCSTCVRSHRFASSSNPALLQIEPECTYDDPASGSSPAKPRTKYKVLEDKISQLESLLKQQLLKEGEPSPPMPLASESTSSDAFIGNLGEHELFDTGDILDPYDPTSMDRFAAPGTNQTTSSPSDSSMSSRQLIISGWSKRFPKPDLLHHLIDVFFNCYPHAHYIIHRPTFMLSLTLSPKSPEFPHVSLLHAICAYAGVFSYLIEPPPGSDLDKTYPDFIFGDRRRPELREESFAEMHARWAKETSEQALAMGFNLFEITQAQVILADFYQCQGRSVELWSTIGNVLRCAVPLGLHTSPGFRGDGTKRDPARLSENPDTLLPDPINCTEREVRVNLFWVAYSNERFHDTPCSWAMSLDDQDIHQVLPGSLSNFEEGRDIQGPRQFLQSTDALLQHFAEVTDGFSLYIKAFKPSGAILISKARWFNLRVRHKNPDVADVRALPEFHQLEQLIGSFKKSFPRHYTTPIVQFSRGLDTHHLFNELRYHQTSSDMHGMSVSPPRRRTVHVGNLQSCWGRAASILIRFYKVEIGRGHQGEALAIDLEIQSVKYVLNQLGTRLPIALKNNKVLEFELQTNYAHMAYSVSQKGLPSDHGDLHISPGNSAWLESRSSGSQGEVTPFTSSSSPLPSLFTDTSTSSLSVLVNVPPVSFESISTNELDTLGQAFGGPF